MLIRKKTNATNTTVNPARINIPMFSLTKNIKELKIEIIGIKNKMPDSKKLLFFKITSLRFHLRSSLRSILYI